MIISLIGALARVRDPLVVHVQRPYATVEEYLEAEAWTIETRSMLLIDADELLLDTAVLFDVSIKGEKLIRAVAPGRGLRHPRGWSRPAGSASVRRYGASTKAFIDRAVSWAERAFELAQPSQPEPPRRALRAVDRHTVDRHLRARGRAPTGSAESS